MSVVLLGVVAALGWGLSDFIAQFTARALGHDRALMFVLSSSTILLTAALYLWAFDQAFLGIPAQLLPLLAATGLSIGVALFFIFWAFSRGPMSVVAPIIAAYPGLNVAFAFVSGDEISSAQYVLMGLILVGVIFIASAVDGRKQDTDGGRSVLFRTLAIALGAMVLSACAFELLAESSRQLGEVRAVLVSRWFALLTSVILYLLVRQVRMQSGVDRFRFSRSSLVGLVIVQGGLDVLAYLSAAAGAKDDLGVVTIVISSTFGVVTAIMARVFLKERIATLQWVGIACVGLAVAGLAYLSV